MLFVPFKLEVNFFQYVAVKANPRFIAWRRQRFFCAADKLRALKVI
jgi:hypothetical protein